jgi:hypothetical protein
MPTLEGERVRDLCERIGYGRVMQLAEALWGAKARDEGNPGLEHTTGPCAVMMVPCRHPVRDANGHCEVCCGSGRVTKWVAANLPPAAPQPEE